MPTPRDALFLRVVDDLERRTMSSDWFDVLGIAANLRLLLSDSDPLVHQVNRSRRLQVSFHARAYADGDSGKRMPLMLALGDAFDPDLSPHMGPGRTVDIQGLLAMRVMVLLSQWVTVRDVIAYHAHVAGAVHAGKPKSAQDQAVSGVEAMGFPFSQAPIHELRAIGRVVLRGLAPLRSAVASENRG